MVPACTTGSEPETVCVRRGDQDGFGFERFLGPTGQRPPSAKALKAFGGGIVKRIEDHGGDISGAHQAV
jgi:hypothetical protein